MVYSHGNNYLETTSEYRYQPLGIDTPCKIHKLEYIFTSEYRYSNSSFDTLSCRSAFIAGRKLPNGSIDDLTYQNGWKSVRGYKNKLLKLQQQQEYYLRAKIKFKSSFVLN
ncbi:hypothetical protein GQ457_15G010740 [Hibiscus cannabinus]